MKNDKNHSVLFFILSRLRNFYNFNVLLQSAILTVCFITTGCDTYNTKSPVIKDKLVNLKGINTPDDDFNASIFPYLFYITTGHINMDERIDINLSMIYSSDRGTPGNLNVHLATLSLQQEMKEHQFSDNIEISSSYESEFMQNLNTENNERGPIFLGYRNIITYNTIYDSYYSEITPYINSPYSYSSDCSGDFDIYIFYNESYNGDIIKKKTFFSKQGSNERYGSLLHGYTDKDADYYGKIIFSSDRSAGSSEDFDIYQTAKFTGNLAYCISGDDESADQTITKIDILSSDKDDDYPYIYEDNSLDHTVIFFSSNRSGGNGGFDIYYSLYDRNKDKFLQPVNFAAVNSQYNEYRPSLYYISCNNSNIDISYYILIFSSDRPGGEGKIDLYTYFFSTNLWRL